MISKQRPVWLILISVVLFSLAVNCIARDSVDETEQYTYKIVRSFPHDPNAFTQGLAIDSGILYEGTGQYGKSSLRRVELETGKVLLEHRLPRSVFGEGITVFGDRIVQLTWRANFGQVYDKKTFKLLRVFSYPGEGWGITNDGKHLIMSDGTDIIRYLDPETFKEIKRIHVMGGGRPVEFLNELEFVKGRIYANIWKSDRIAIIDPMNGRVRAWLDLTGILFDKGGNLQGKGNVLNGIAYDVESDSLYVTGKLWPRIFQIELQKQQ